MTATTCTCTEYQLAQVGCDCGSDIGHSHCTDCGVVVRSATEVAAKSCGCADREAAWHANQRAIEAAYWDAEHAKLEADGFVYTDPREDFAEWSLAAARHQ